uniref:hypothetical protein n=1 Tax=Trichocoleus desertorum TaxID=1481672 RepID=UPI0025B4237F|nr:hypothetical protein [Trichocoleus desertorum]
MVLFMATLRKATNAIVGSSLLAAIISIALQSPATARLVNEKLGGLGQSDWNAYCARKINGSAGTIVATLADTHVQCKVAILVSGSSQANANANASMSGRRAGLQGSITASGKSGSQWLATFTSFQNAYHLNDWCRQKYAPRFYLPNVFTGEGRIFVGDGGRACYKTVNK